MINTRQENERMLAELEKIDPELAKRVTHLTDEPPRLTGVALNAFLDLIGKIRIVVPPLFDQFPAHPKVFGCAENGGKHEGVRRPVDEQRTPAPGSDAVSLQK